MGSEGRIKILDGFRSLSILAVVLLHYYSIWFPPKVSKSLYSYGSKFDYFSYGGYGVQFFFIISGFVIAYTLTRTDSVFYFWIKRLIRLLPSIVLCSAIILFVFVLFDSDLIFPKSHKLINFLYSITLISPEILNKLFSLRIQGDYISMNFWSLWPEVQFYFLAGLIYYFNKSKFVINFFVFVFAVTLVHNFINNEISSPYLFKFSESFIYIYHRFTFILSFLDFGAYFLLGVLFYGLYINPESKLLIFSIVLSVLLIFYLENGFVFNTFLPTHTILIMVALFFIMIYRSHYLSFLSYSPFSIIGISSYTLYLIHHEIGVLLIYKFSSLFGTLDFIFPIFVTILMIGFSYFVYIFIEKPVSKFLYNKLF